MENLNTPCFILDIQALEKNVCDMKKALNKHYSNWIIGYSFKTNSLLYVIDYLKTHDCYAEVVSDQEYRLAKAVGYTNIIYNGPMKSLETFYEALNDQQIVNIETYREIEWLKKYNKPARVGVRVNFDLEQYCPNESACKDEGGRFGFCFENGKLKEVIDELQLLPHVEIVGLHLHVSTKTRSVNVYRAIAQVAKKVIEIYDLTVSYVDVGGGFFGGMPTKPSFETYFGAIKEILGDQYTIIVEPGASLIASPFSYVTSVIDVKDTSYNRFVVVDGSRNDLDPQFKKTNYLYALQTNSNLVHPKQVIAGFTCMEHDRLMVLENQQALMINDKIVFDKVGSYTMCLSPNFIKYYPEVYVYENGQYSLIRKRWDVEEYIAGAKKYGK